MVKVEDWIVLGTLLQSHEQVIDAPLPTTTEKGGNAITGRVKNWAIRGCMILCELPEFTKIVMVNSGIVPLRRKVCREGNPNSASYDKWKWIVSKEASSAVWVRENRGNGGGRGCGWRSGKSEGSKENGSESVNKRRRNCFNLQRWPGENLSSQLKQRPLEWYSCISVGVRRLIGNGVLVGGVGKRGVLGGGGSLGRWVREALESSNLDSMSLSKLIA